MNTNLKEPELTYALNKEGQMVSILDVPNGLSCNCSCPKCKQPLVARNNERNIRQKHFSHYGSTENSANHACHGYYMTALHLLAEQIIKKKKEVMAPAYESIDANVIKFNEVVVEEFYEKTKIKPDVIGITQNDGYKCCIEIRNTSAVDSEKRSKIVDSGIICMEIDVRKVLLDDLEDFILKSSEHREWINNPIYEKIIEKKKFQSNIVQKSEEKDLSPIDKYFNSLNTNDSFEANTVISNYSKTRSGNEVVVYHITKQCPYTCYITTVTFRDGQPVFYTFNYDDPEKAERKYYDLMGR